MEGLKLSATWTNDCQGKKDYDGDILSISTRYWPGSYQANRMVSALSQLVLRYGESGASGDYVVLARAEFEAGTFETLAPQVEQWAQEQMDRAVAALVVEFGPPSKP
jgi:hypothetical protein